MKKLILFIWLALLLGAISYVLWHEDWKYSLPTPVPKDYDSTRTVNGSFIMAKAHAPLDKPLFLHFFNPDCPCSKFNIPHVRSLVNKFGDRVNFAVVVMADEKKFTVEDIRDRFDLPVPILFDREIADSCGVYSTPQAVIIDKKQKLYYRGNYNRSRFCVDKNTNFAQMALDSLTSNRENLITDKAALKSYGCSLPNCKKVD